MSALEITQGTALQFGTMTVPTADVIVDLTPTGNRTAGAGITLLGAAASYSAASYTVTGTLSSPYKIYLPTTPLTLASGVTVDNFTSSLGAGNAGVGTGALAPFSVGAKLNLVSGTAAGSYSASFNVTAVYE